MIIHIEIKKSEYKEKCFDYRIGDIEGSISFHNMYKKELIDDISDEIDKLQRHGLKEKIE